MSLVKPVYRPPNEWQSFLLQVTLGCSHNACTYCGMYKDKPYQLRPLHDVLEDIEVQYFCYGPVGRIFLCDGDAIAAPTDYLLEVLERIRKKFPNCKKIGTYAGPRSTLKKTPEELKSLREAGLTRCYLGVETGLDSLLKKVGKGVNATQMQEAGQRLVEAGFDVYAFIMIGLAGKEFSAEHIAASADIISNIRPQHLSAMTYMPVPGTKMYKDIEDGRFKLLTEEECLWETRSLIEQLQVENLHFASMHASNYVPIQGTLPEDKSMLLSVIDEALAGNIKTLGQRGL